MARLWYLGASSSTTVSGQERYTPRHRESSLHRHVELHPSSAPDRTITNVLDSHWFLIKSKKKAKRNLIFRGLWYFLFSEVSNSITQMGVKTVQGFTHQLLIYQIRGKCGYNDIFLHLLCFYCLNWLISLQMMPKISLMVNKQINCDCKWTKVSAASDRISLTLWHKVNHRKASPPRCFVLCLCSFLPLLPF